jgi:hypothetical protein
MINLGNNFEAVFLNYCNAIKLSEWKVISAICQAYLGIAQVKKLWLDLPKSLDE